MDDDFWPEDEVDGAPAPSPGHRSASVPALPAGTRPAAPLTPPPPTPAPLTAQSANGEPTADAEPSAGGEQPIYAPPAVDGMTARAGVPVALPPRTVPQPLPTGSPAQMPGDLPQAPESAWAQPPTAQYPLVPATAPQATETAAPRPQVQPLHGVPHQVPPAPMRRPAEAPAISPPPVQQPPAAGPVEVWQPAPPGLPAYPPKELEPPRPGPHQLPGPAVRPMAAPPPATGTRTPPTAEEFARRRAEQRPQPQAERGLRGAVRKSTFGLINPTPGRREQEYHEDVELIRRNFGGLRQITVVNPKGGAGKTVAVLMLAMTFGQQRGGYVLAWDNNETQGTLGMRAQQDFHARTVRDLLRDMHLFQGASGRVGDLSQYVRAQGEGMFEVLASDESATAGEMLTDVAFGGIRDVVSRFYKIIVVDTGNNVRAPNWQAAVDATDQLVVTMSARNDSAETAARMLDHLEQTGRVRAVRQAVTVLSMPQNQRELDVPGIERHFAARTRTVLRVPYERVIDTGEPIGYSRLSPVTRDAWLKVAAAVASGL